jgi:hypothetical protein
LLSFFAKPRPEASRNRGLKLLLILTRLPTGVRLTAPAAAGRKPADSVVSTRVRAAPVQGSCRVIELFIFESPHRRSRFSAHSGLAVRPSA